MIERDVVQQGRQNGQMTMDFPITKLRNVEDAAEVKGSLAEGDYIPVMDGADGGQMKKAPFSALASALASAGGGTEASSVTFTAAQWTAGTDERGSVVDSLTIPAASHGQSGGNILYQLYALRSDGTYLSGTWGTMCTSVQRLANGDLVLTTDEGYSGKIAFAQ